MLNLLSGCCVSSGKEQKSKDNPSCLKRAHGLTGEMVPRALKRSADVVTATKEERQDEMLTGDMHVVN